MNSIRAPANAQSSKQHELIHPALCKRLFMHSLGKQRPKHHNDYEG